MSVRDYFVAAVAVVIGCLALASALRVPALGLEHRAYELRSVRAVQQRCGDWAARTLLFGVAILMFLMGASIVASSPSAGRDATSLPESALR